MKTIIQVVLLFFFTILFNLESLHAQKVRDTTVYVELTSINPNSDDSDLKQLAPYFKDITIVGMGESTHGTHEFSVMRHRMFRYLVENHGFNTFFLEADYANCLRVNNYIHGKNDSVKVVVSEIGLWPWQTTEMADLINWMRTYNEKNNNKLNFIGVDMQQYVETIKQLDYILTQNNLPITDSIVYQKMSDTNFVLITEKGDLEIYKTMLKEKKVINISQLNKEDKRVYNILLRHLSQIIEEKYKWKKDYDYRDRKMAKNILFHIKVNPAIKGIFWAHNGHMCNIILKKQGKKKWHGFAGGYLKNQLKEQYYSIGLEFDEGSFNAYYPDTNSNRIMEGRAYTLGAVTVGPSSVEHLIAKYRKLKTPLFIDCTSLPKKEHLKMNSIGAAYYPSKDDKPKSLARNNYFGQKGFDAIILIKKSTPTHLLKIR